MIIRSIEDVRGTDAERATDSWTSRRLLLQGDGMGFTVTETTLEPGAELTLWYKHHLEACLCLEGEATIEDVATGATHAIGPGTLYALDRHDRHRLTTHTKVRLVCVFVPPLTGREIHDTDGSYAPPPE